MTDIGVCRLNASPLNTSDDMTSLVGGYKAAAGWACTGLGSPDGSEILAALERSKQHEVRPDEGISHGDTQVLEKSDVLAAKRHVSRRKK